MSSSPRPLLPKVLYVSTHGWNPGDNFIQMGVERLLAAVAGSPRVSGIYNKAPQVTSFWRPLQRWRQCHGRGPWSLLHGVFDTVHFDNSHKRCHGIDGFDAVVFSGSPGWSGPRLTELYRKLQTYRGEILFLGIGTPNRKIRLSRREVRVLRTALVITREEELQGTLQQRYGIESRVLPCPALFSAPSSEKAPALDGPVGFVFSARRSVRNQAISNRAYTRQVELFEALLDRTETELVCHYSDDLDHAIRRFGSSVPIHHHFEAHAFRQLYRRFSFVVSTRVHGCGMASSLGIPNALIGHDRRAGTVHGFHSRLLDSEMGTGLADLMEEIEQDPEARQRATVELRQHRQESFEAYCAVLARHLGTTPPSSSGRPARPGTA